MNVLFFALIACISLAAALGVVLSRKPVHSALFLMTNFASLAILYVLLDAQFLAAAQVIIYAGGIVILILFVIMLIGHETDGPADRRRLGQAGFISLALAVVMAVALGTQLTGPWTQSVAGVPSGGAPARHWHGTFHPLPAAFRVRGHPVAGGPDRSPGHGAQTQA